MGRLFRFELRKLFRQVSFYVCLAVLLGVTFLGVFSTYSVMKLAQSELGIELDLGMLGMFGDAADRFSGRGYLLTALGGNNLTLLLGIFTALFICSDYANGTAKNVIGRGYTRAGFTAAKQAVTALGVLAFCLVACAVSFLAGTAYFGIGKNWQAGDVSLLLVQILVILAYASFFMFLSFLFRKSGAAIALNIMAPTVIALVLSIIDIFTEKKEIYLSRYWLAECLSVSTDLYAETADLTRSGTVAAVYLVTFILLTHLVTARRDV